VDEGIRNSAERRSREVLYVLIFWTQHYTNLLIIRPTAFRQWQRNSRPQPKRTAVPNAAASSCAPTDRGAVPTVVTSRDTARTDHRPRRSRTDHRPTDRVEAGSTTDRPHGAGRAEAGPIIDRRSPILAVLTSAGRDDQPAARRTARAARTALPCAESSGRRTTEPYAATSPRR
jgi:hypothetical protein